MQRFRVCVLIGEKVLDHLFTLEKQFCLYLHWGGSKISAKQYWSEAPEVWQCLLDRMGRAYGHENAPIQEQGASPPHCLQASVVVELQAWMLVLQGSNKFSFINFALVFSHSPGPFLFTWSGRVGPLTCVALLQSIGWIWCDLRVGASEDIFVLSWCLTLQQSPQCVNLQAAYVKTAWHRFLATSLLFWKVSALTVFV